MATPPGATQLEPSDFPNLPDAERLARALNPFLQSTGNALRAGLTFRDNFQGFLKVLEVTAPEDWTAYAFGTNWSTFDTTVFGAPGWQKSATGRVYARGAVRYTGPGSPSAESLVLSGGPASAFRARLAVDMTSAPGLLTLNVDGSLVFGYGNPAVVSLADIQYEAANRTPSPWPTPVDFALPTTFTSKPGSVLVLRAEEVANSAPISAVSVDGWRVQPPQGEDAKQIIRLPRVNGLTPGLRYRLTLLVLPE